MASRKVTKKVILTGAEDDFEVCSDTFFDDCAQPPRVLATAEVTFQLDPSKRWPTDEEIAERVRRGYCSDDYVGMTVNQALATYYEYLTDEIDDS